MILDTCFLIDLEHELGTRQVGVARKWLAQNRNTPQSISMITVGECAVGFEKLGAVRQFLARYRIIPVHLELALLASRLERALRASGGQIGENDNWIAATAVYYGVPVVTRNIAEFQRAVNVRLPGRAALRLRDYVKEVAETSN